MTWQSGAGIRRGVLSRQAYCDRASTECPFQRGLIFGRVSVRGISKSKPVYRPVALCDDAIFGGRGPFPAWGKDRVVDIIRDRGSRVDKNEKDVYKSYASHDVFSVDDLSSMVSVLKRSIVPNHWLPVR